MDKSYKQIVANVSLEVKPFDNKKSGLARVAVDLTDPPINIKGFVIREKDGQKFVSAPSYGNRRGKLSPNVWMPNELWHLLIEKILKTYEDVISNKQPVDN